MVEMTAERKETLKATLLERRREVEIERQKDFLAPEESRDDIYIALTELKTETLGKIDESLARLEKGVYGYCSECGEEISERRLKALVFAVRCKDCEELREIIQQRERMLLAQRHNLSNYF